MKIHKDSSKSYPSMVVHPQILYYSLIMHQIIHCFVSDTSLMTKEKAIIGSLYVKKVWYYQNSMINIRKYCKKKSNINNNTKKHISDKLDEKQQIKH